MFRRMSRVAQGRNLVLVRIYGCSSRRLIDVRLCAVCLVGAKGFPGQLHFEVAQLISHPSFLDYIRGGCEINFMVAIDFTASK